jgi:hypothetical protein
MWFGFRLSRNVGVGLPWWLALPVLFVYAFVYVGVWLIVAALWLVFQLLAVSARAADQHLERRRAAKAVTAASLPPAETPVSVADAPTQPPAGA